MIRRFLVVLGLLATLLLRPVWAADVGIFLQPDCNTLSPAMGMTFCFDETANRLFSWDGSGWISDAANGLGVANVKDKRFGAKGDGVTDDTAAIQAAINYWPSGGGVVVFPPGSYKVTDTLTVAQNRVNLLGAGRQVSALIFSPASERAAILFDRGGGLRIIQNSIRGMALRGSGTVMKHAIRIIDAEELVIEDVAISTWRDDTHTSIGIQSRGRAMLRLNRVTINADIPIKLEQNPNIRIDLDHYHFSNTYLISHSTQPCIVVDDGVIVTNWTIDGSNAWVPGTYGLYWNDTTSTVISLAVNISNVRIEQEKSAAAYLFYISHNHALMGLKLENIYGGVTAGGYYLRRVTHATILNSAYVSTTNEAINIDETVRGFTSINNFWQWGSTARITGQRVVFAVPKPAGTGAMLSTAIYDVSSNSDGVTQMDGVLQANLGLRVNERSGNPGAPTQDAQVNLYMKGDKLVIQYNNAGTLRYFTLDLTQSGATASWGQSTVAP